MTPKEALRDFTSRYPREAIDSLSELADDRSLTTVKFQTFQLTESADKLSEYLAGYVKYKTDGPTPTAKELTNDSIMEGTRKLIDDQLFTESSQMCSDAVDFVLAYLEHLHDLDEQLTDGIVAMMEAGSEPEDVGLLSDIADSYLQVLTEKVNGVMDHLLTMSGYNARQALLAAAKGHTGRSGSNREYFL